MTKRATVDDFPEGAWVKVVRSWDANLNGRIGMVAQRISGATGRYAEHLGYIPVTFNSSLVDQGTFIFRPEEIELIKAEVTE